jgi:hypothetical protein
MATVLMMLSIGASTQSIVSELLIQAAILAAHGQDSPNESAFPYPGYWKQSFWSVPLSSIVSNVQYGFHRLLGDYIRLANKENAALVAPAAISTAGSIGAVLAGAAGTVLVGILGYSAVTKTSPIETTKLALARAGRLRSRF